MAKLLLLAPLMGLALGSSMPPWAPMAGLGFLEGFLSNNPVDVDSCVSGALKPISDIESGIADIKKGVKERNLTDIEQGILDLRQFVHTDLRAAMEACKVAEADVKAILQVLKEFHSLADIIAHVKADVTADSAGQIAAEMELMVKSFEGKQYQEFGKHAGNLVHRLFVGQSQAATVSSSLPPWAPMAGLGFLEGFLSDNSADTDACIGGALAPIADAQTTIKDIKQGVKDKNLTEIDAGVEALHQLLQDLPKAMQTCKAAEVDIKAIMKVVKEIHSLKDIVAHVKADFNVDTAGEIAAEFELMVRSFEAKKYSEFGNHAGKLMHHLFIGQSAGVVVV